MNTSYSLNSVDITDSLSEIFHLILIAFKFCYDFLKGIQFAGTNLLSICITIALLSIIFPIIFSVVRSGSTVAIREGISASKRRRQSREESSKK